MWAVTGTVKVAPASSGCCGRVAAIPADDRATVDGLTASAMDGAAADTTVDPPYAAATEAASGTACAVENHAAGTAAAHSPTPVTESGAPHAVVVWAPPVERVRARVRPAASTAVRSSASCS